MKFDKIATILMLTLIIAGAAFYFSDQEMEKVEDRDGGVVFLSGLMSKINQVAQVIVTEEQSSTHLKLKDNRWIVEEKAGYDAEFSKVKKLLLGLAELKTIEPKTSKPENYGRLGVQNVGDDGEVSSRQVQLLDKADNVLYTLIVGKSKTSSVPGAGATYVRRLNEAESWLVNGEIDIPDSQIDWLNKAIINLSASRIQSIEITQPDKSQLLISKKEKADKNYHVENLPDKAELKSENVANSIANALQNLSFDEVLSRGTFQADDKKITQVVFKTFDGLQLMAQLSIRDDKNFLWFDTKTTSDDEKITQESSDLNAKFALWVYEISSAKASTFQKKLEELLKTEG